MKENKIYIIKIDLLNRLFNIDFIINILYT